MVDCGKGKDPSQATGFESDVYLVLGCCGIDDIPMRIFPGHQKEEAITYARGLTRADVRETARGEVYKRDTSIVCNISLVTLDVQGIPSDYTVVRDFDDEDD